MIFYSSKSQFVILATFLLCSVCLASATNAIAPANPVSDDALSGHEYPWYDAEARSIKSPKLDVGAEPSSSDRDSVPLGKKKVQKAAPVNNGTSGSGGGFGGGGAFAGGPEIAGTLSTILIGLAILVVVAALVITFLRIESADKENSETTGRSREQSIEQLPFDLEASDGDFQTAAQSAYQRGDLRQAIILLYSHILVTLDQNSLIRLRKGKTNRQYLNEVRSRRSIAGYFRQVMLPFESVFFGDHEMDADEFEQCWAGLNRFHDNVKSNDGVLIG